jgi:hypothetical protein
VFGRTLEGDALPNTHARDCRHPVARALRQQGGGAGSHRLHHGALRTERVRGIPANTRARVRPVCAPRLKCAHAAATQAVARGDRSVAVWRCAVPVPVGAALRRGAGACRYIVFSHHAIGRVGEGGGGASSWLHALGVAASGRLRSAIANADWSIRMSRQPQLPADATRTQTRRSCCHRASFPFAWVWCGSSIPLHADAPLDAAEHRC